MAKRKTTRKPAKRKSAKPEAAFKPGVPREIIAVLLAAVTVLLAFAAFNFGGSLPQAMLSGLRQAFGFAAYALPVVTGALAYMLFRAEVYNPRAVTYFGMAGFVASLSALLHVPISAAQAESVAQNGSGGGYLGWAISRVLLNFLNVAASVVVLLALLAIFVMMAVNLPLREIFTPLLARFKRQPTPEELKINDPAATVATGEPVVNSSLPFRGPLDVGSKNKTPKEDETALVSRVDADWQYPSLDLLNATASKGDAGNVKENASHIQTTLANFGIEVQMGEVNLGPTVSQYTLIPPAGIKLSKITGLEQNLALALAAPAIRVEAPIPGKSAVGVEIPNKAAATVRLRQLLSMPEISSSKAPLEIVLGLDVSGKPASANLADMPHLLIAGATGAGKSVMINTLLASLLYRNSPSQLQLILIDPKRVELNLYNDIPHLLSKVIVEPDKAVSALKWAVAEMERRLKLFSEVGKRNIIEYNSMKAEDKENMPYIVIVIDEMSDLMMAAGADVEALIVRLSQLARAAGIHLVLATQRPSVNVITGLIKANVPTRIAFRVASQVDSRTIIDLGGAEKLLGKGDMLFLDANTPKPRRIQGVFIDEKEVTAITSFLREQKPPQYNDDVISQPVKVGGGGGGGMDDADDDLFDEAAEAVIRAGKASTSMLQRRLRIGYARAARLIDILEDRGVVGPADGARPRDVLVRSLDELGGGVVVGAADDEVSFED